MVVMARTKGAWMSCRVDAYLAPVQRSNVWMSSIKNRKIVLFLLPHTISKVSIRSFLFLPKVYLEKGIALGPTHGQYQMREWVW